MTHEVFSIVAPVAGPDAAEALRRRINPARDGRQPIPGLSLDRLPMLHYASLVVFDGQEVREEPGRIGRWLGRPARTFTTGPRLVFECCIDGPRDAFLDALLHIGGPALHEIFSHCLGYPAGAGARDTGAARAGRESGGTHEPGGLRAWIVAHIRRPHLLHVGNPGMRAAHIRAGHALREKIDDHLDRLVRLRRSLDPPLTIVNQVRDALNVPAAPGAWHLSSEAVPGNPAAAAWFDDPAAQWPSRIVNWLKLAAFAAVPIGVLLYLFFARGVIAAALAWIAFIVLRKAAGRYFKGSHPPPAEDRERFRQLKELEDFGVANHMASFVMLKRGRLHLLRVRYTLFFFELLYRTIFTDITPGRLRGLQTIHFAHWTVIDLLDREGKPTGRHALLFLSNYDGSWETYLDDFIAFLLGGVVRIWSSGERFPWPLDGPAFKTWARECMSPWDHWYQAYPTLSVINIENNDAIRKGLLAPMRTEMEARRWLLRFGSARVRDEQLMPTPGTLESRDIQGLVFSGYRRLPHAMYVLLRVRDAEAARRWLGAIASEVTDGRIKRKEELELERLAINIAFTHAGLQRLGLPDQVLHAFPSAFQEGMAPKGMRHRSRALGDHGASDPAKWRWGGYGNGNGDGGDEARVDILLMIYALTPEDLRAAVAARVDAFETVMAGKCVDRIEGGFMAVPKGNGADPKLSMEHFGFVDGVSQPVIEGTFIAAKDSAAESSHLLKPGEFVLGYPAGDGTIAAGVPVDPRFDRHQMLPLAAAPAAGQAMRDFGRNGTYLVFRQLEQDVAAFRAFTAKASGANGPPYHPSAGARVGAHIVGRWRDGVPLTAVNAPGRNTNEFTFSGDAHGFSCPIGSHVRRANPRDSLLDVPSAALASANRHRLLRRGRTYGPPLALDAHGHDDRERGLVFMCLNSDIERQFEFVQQNWLNNPCFGGLYDERDPLVSPQPNGGGRLTLQADGVRERIGGIGQYVTVKCGGYFFMPGLSALRYLAHGDAVSPPVLSSAAALAADPRRVEVRTELRRLPAGEAARAAHAAAVQRPSLLYRMLSWAEDVLPKVRTLWAARFPLLLAAVLVLLPQASRWIHALSSWTVSSVSSVTTGPSGPSAVGNVNVDANVGPNFNADALLDRWFVLDWWGLALVSLIASLSAFASLIALRIVMLYGWRSGLRGARWTGSVTWPKIFAFHLLALPIVWAAIDRTARATLAGAAGGWPYWRIVLDLIPAALAGGLAAIALLLAATSIQSIWRGARPDLFFPPNPLFKNLAGPGAQGARVSKFAQRMTRLGAWIVDSVPEEIGRGYIDYRVRRVLPGHAFAAVFAALVVIGYIAAVIIITLSPAADAFVPPLAFFLLTVMAAAWTLSAIAFFFDRYHIPIVLPIGVTLVAIEFVRRAVAGE
jgi:Dyp-type peroxidase family